MDIMEYRRDIQSPLQSSDSQLCGLFCIHIAHFFYNEKFQFIPDVNESELVAFVKYMKQQQHFLNINFYKIEKL